MSQPTFGAAPKTRLSKNKKIGLFAIGGIGGLAIVIWYRRRQQSSNTAAQNTGDPNTVDPNTGIPYSQEGYGAAGTPGLYGQYDPLTGGYTPGPGTVNQVYSPNNAMWAQQSEAYLTGQGYDPVTVAAALGLYLAGQPLSQDQYDIVTAAIGFEGQPPNGAPPPILAGGGGGGQGGTPGTTVTVPNVIGSTRTTAGVLIRSKGLHFVAHQSGNGAPGTSWIVRDESPSGGTKVKVGSTVTVTVDPKRAAKTSSGKFRIGPIRR